MTTQIHKLGSNWQLIGTGKALLQSVSSGRCCIHFADLANTPDQDQDAFHILDMSALLPYNGGGFIYARAMDGKAHLAITPITTPVI